MVRTGGGAVGEPELPLAGLRVLDLSRVLAGPYAAMILGDLGAEVVKVEHPATGDDTRAWGPPHYPGGESAYFASVNRNKRSVAIDLATDEGRRLLAALIEGADVVVENFRPGTLERWGFDADWFAAAAPRAVRATISGYGSWGPKAGRPGYDFVLQAETGLMAITGEVGGEPMKLGVAIVDLCAGFLATIGILAALEARHRTGRGRHVEANLHDTGIALLANVAGNVLASGAEAGRFGNAHASIVPYRTYAAADGGLALAVGNDAQFARFAALAGHPEWASDERYATNPARVRNRDEVDALVGAAIATRTRAAWTALLAQAGIPAGPIDRVSEALASEQTAARGLVAEVDHATAGLMRVLRLPIELDGTLPPVRRAPPTLGEHTDEILAELGVDRDRAAALRESGVVAGPATR